MAADRDDRACLWDMLAAARAVWTFVEHRTFEDYLADLLLRSAVERQLEIIGEAARRVSKPFQDAHPEIPWRPIQAQRHVLAHELFVAVGGFTKDAEDEARTQEKRKVTLVSLERLVDLWVEYYSKLDDDARRKLPLRPIYFLAPEA